MRSLTLFAATALSCALAGCTDTPVDPIVASEGGAIYFTALGPAAGGEPAMVGMVVDAQGNVLRQFDSILFDSRPRAGTMTYREAYGSARWAARTDGSDRRRLVQDRGLGRFGQVPALSPDGRLLAYIEEDSTTADDRDGIVIVERTDGSGCDVIATGAAVDVNAVFSPDGSVIAYPGTDYELYSISVGGGVPRALGRFSTKRDTIWMVTGLTPAWSPDGRRILLNVVAYGVIEFPADGSRAGLEPIGPRVSFGGGDVTWSPDGSRIAIARSTSIVLLDERLDSMRTIEIGERAEMPQWSPDGRSLLYVAFNSSLSGPLRVLDVETGNVRTLAERSFYAFWER